MQPHNPIQHVVIIVKENHSFDNYFGSFPGANGTTLPPAQDPPAGGDPSHDHAAWLQRATHAVKLQYSEKDIPAYFSFARQFTLCDNYFTEVASQSEPNHLMLIAAASPVIDNASKSRTYQPQEPFKLPTLPKALEKVKLTWATYGDPGFSYFDKIEELKGSPNILPWTRFDIDVAGGEFAERVLGIRPEQPSGAFRASPVREKRRAADGQTGQPMDRRARPQTGAEQALGQLSDLHYLGRLGWLVRPCGSAVEEQVDRRRSCEGAWLHQHAIQLRNSCRLPRDQPLFEAGNRQGISFAREPGKVLRNDVWYEATQRERSGVRRHV